MEVSNISYFLFKPESEKCFGKMRKYIEENFQKVRYFAVPDWQNTIKKLYYKHYENKGEKFGDMLEALLAVQKELYGSNAIVALVRDNDVSKEELLQRVYDTKIYLRNIYSKPSAISIVSNADELQIPQKRKIKNSIKIVDEKGEEKRFKGMNQLGNYRIQFLNYIHSPDPCAKTSDEEIEILKNEKILTKQCMISKEDIDLISKYKTFEIIENYRNSNDKNTISEEIEI